MKKTISWLMTIVMLCIFTAPLTACSKEAIEKYIENRETPIAEDYVSAKKSEKTEPVSAQKLESAINSEAGSDFAKVYNSEADYKAEQKKQTEKILQSASQSYEVVQTFKVKEWTDGSPVKGAVVLINDIPRYTNRDGEVKAKLQRGAYVFLRVEKEGYVSYIDYYVVKEEETEFTIEIKQPSDDIWFESVTLSYDGEQVNLTQQSYSIDRVEETYDSHFSINVQSNVDFDYCKITQNDKIVFENATGYFEGENLTDYFENGSGIYVTVEYEGIQKTQELLLNFIEINEIDIAAYLGLKETSQKNAKSKQSLTSQDYDFGDPILGGFEIDFSFLIKSLFVDKKHGYGGKFSIVHDNKLHCTKILIGFDMQKTWKNSTSQGKMQMYDSFRRSYDASHKPNLPNVNPKNIFESLARAFKSPEVVEAAKILKSTNSFEIITNFSLYGYIEIYDEMIPANEEAELPNRVRSMGLELMGGIDYEKMFQKAFMLPAPVPIPIPYYLVVGFGFSVGGNIQLLFQDTIKVLLEIFGNIYGKLGAGLGVGKICGINVYGKLILNGATNLQNYGGLCLNVSLGVEGTILLFNFDIPIWDSDGFAYQGFGDFQNHLPLKSSKAKLYNANATTEESSAQIVESNGKKIKTHLVSKADGDKYNNSCLYYSVEENGVWSAPAPVYDNGKIDFEPCLKIIGGTPYLTWSKNKLRLTGETTVDEMLANQEIYLARFDDNTNTFVDIEQLTNDDSYDSKPCFAQSNVPEVLWQKNTANDFLGMRGDNFICSKKLSSQIYETKVNGLLADYDKLTINSEKYILSLVDLDSDLSTANDRKLTVTKNGTELRAVTGNIRSASFIRESSNVAYILDNRIICESLEDTKILFELEITGDVNEFKIDNLSGNYVISYLERDNNGNINIKLNTLTASGVESFFISDSTNDIYEYDLIMHSDKIAYYATASKRDESGKTLYHYPISGEKTFEQDLELVNCLQLQSLKIGENALSVTVKNNGVFAFDAFDVIINENITVPVILEEALNQNAETTVQVEYNLTNIPKRLTIEVKLKGEELTYENNKTELSQDFCDIVLSVEEYLKGGAQEFKVTLKNNLPQEENVWLLIRKGEPNGEVVFESERYLLTEPLSFIVRLDYKKLKILEGEMLYFELITEREEFVKSSDVQIAQGYTPPPYDEELYLFLKQALEEAKQLI